MITIMIQLPERSSKRIKEEFPLYDTQPIAVTSREILQYSSNIREMQPITRFQWTKNSKTLILARILKTFHYKPARIITLE